MRAKCVCKPLNSAVRARITRSPQRTVQESVKGRPFLFLKPHRHISQIPTTDTRKLVLYTLIKQVQNGPKGERKQLPGNFMDVLGDSRPRTLSLSEPAVQWMSFLLRDGRATLAIRVFSTFLHRGYHFSLRALKNLCEDASIVPSARPATVFAEYISTALSRRSDRAAPTIRALIQTFYLHGKHEAVLMLGSLALPKDVVVAEPLEYRRILQSMLKLHGLARRVRPEDNIPALKALLSVLSDWLLAVRRDGHRLAQEDVAILVQHLISLLNKQHRRERTVPRAFHAWILSLVEKFSQHLSDPMAKLAFLEAYLDGLETSGKRRALPPMAKSTLSRQEPTYRDLIRWTEGWKETLDSEPSVTQNGLSFGLFPRKSRVLNVLARDRVIVGDKATAVEYIREITSFQTAFSEAPFSTANPHPLDTADTITRRRYIRDARLRYVSTMVRICSYYLRKQELPTLFLVLSFTAHINDLGTFVRLWKRALHLVTQKGRWSGVVGLNALLNLLARTIPPLWGKTVVGDLLFTSPVVLEATLRVALVSSSQQQATGDACCAQNTSELIALAQRVPSAFRHWEAAIVPFTGPLPSPWKEVLKQVGDGGSGEKVRLERSLLDRLARNRKVESSSE